MNQNPSKSDPVYFAAKEANEAASILLYRADAWYNHMVTNGYLNKVRDLWCACHGLYYTGFNDSHTISFSGEQGELTNLAVNHLRNFSQNIINLITGTRPALQTRAVNSDNISLIQARLGNNILDYYMREKKLENYITTAVKYAVQLASGYLKLEWNANIGDEYDYDEESGTIIRNGDIQFTNLNPFDVYFDSNREDDDHEWVLIRSFQTRFNLIAKYPEFEDEILALPTKNQLMSFNFNDQTMDETDLVAVYEFYHNKTEAMPNGRYLMFLSKEIVLLDVDMPYRNLPVYRISCDLVTGTPFGYSPLFDLLPLQEAINSLYSTVLTNQSTFGVQNVLVPRTADISMSQLSGGLNIVEYNPAAGKPEALNLTHTPQEIFGFINMLEKSMETISGINTVTRGNVAATDLKSGTALAMMQSISIQYASQLQQSYVKFMEDVGLGVINILKDHSKLPRMIAIAGIRNKTSVQKFIGEDLKDINRVVVDVSNPLAQTTAGRVQMAEQLLQMGAIKTPDNYFTVIATGRLDVVTENTEHEMLNIRDENERMIAGKTVVAIALDDHRTHIMEHKSVLGDSELRLDPNLVQRVMSHISEHIGLLRNTDPDLLTIIQQQPLGPQGGSPAGQQTPAGPEGPQDPSVQTLPSPTIEQQQGVPGNLPNIPTPPAPFEGAPINPAQQMPN